MPKIYKIGDLKIKDDGDGIFKKKKDKVFIKGEEDYAKASVDSAKVKESLKKLGIGDLSGVKLGKLKKYNAAIEKFKELEKQAKVITEEALASKVAKRSKALKNAAIKAGIDVGKDSAFQNMVLGLKTAIDDASFHSNSSKWVFIPYISICYCCNPWKTESNDSACNASNEISKDKAEEEEEPCDPDPMYGCSEEDEEADVFVPPFLYQMPPW